jgi:hypothetical protein
MGMEELVAIPFQARIGPLVIDPKTGRGPTQSIGLVRFGASPLKPRAYQTIFGIGV